MMKSPAVRLRILFFIFAFLVVPAQAQEEGRVTAKQVQSAIAELEQLAEAEIQNNAVPGLAIAVVFQDEVVYAKGFGVRDTRTNEPVDADTVFQLASISKPIGSTVIAALVGEGIVSWDSRINELDPTFAMYEPWVTREVTLRDMYAHRSGLPEHSGDLLEDLGFTREEVLHRLRYQHPDSSFRSSYAYTNFGLTAAAIAAAKEAGQEWEALSEEKLYKPLDMNSTSSRYADFVARTNKASGHVLIDGNWVDEYQRDPDAQTPAGGVSSSVNDMAKWMRLQLADGHFEGEQIVAEAALAETHHPHILTGFSPFTGLPGFYGLGWNVGFDQQGRLRLGHSGAFALGAGTVVNLVPAEQLGIIILSNGAVTGVPEGLAATFIDLALYGESTHEWVDIYKGRFAQMMQAPAAASAVYATPPASPTPALANSAYVGTYTNDFFGDISIIEQEGGLAIVQGPKKMTFAMKHFDRDTFTYVTEGESAVGPVGITFAIGADGKAMSVLVENLDVGREGTFKRIP